MPAIAIVGIGNSLLQDDGAGIHALGLFSEANDDPDIHCLDAGTVGLAVLDRLFDLDGLVAFDALKSGERPGTVTVLEGPAMDAWLRNGRGSAHEVGLSDLMDGLRLSGQLPRRRALIGIEPEAIDWGTEPTADVAAALAGAAATARSLVRRWRADTTAGEAL